MAQPGQQAGSFPSELRMNPSSARIAALAFAIALTVAACKPAGENNAPATAADAGAPAAATQASDNVAAQITGAGATFIYPLISKWSDDYNKSTGAKVNYQSIGSGVGLVARSVPPLPFRLGCEVVELNRRGECPLVAVEGDVPLAVPRRLRRGRRAVGLRQALLRRAPCSVERDQKRKALRLDCAGRNRRAHDRAREQENAEQNRRYGSDGE